MGVMGAEELVGGPWGSHAHSANTEGRWGAPGNVPTPGPQNNVVVKLSGFSNIMVAVSWRTDPAWLSFCPHTELLSSAQASH